jgi:hypothetical protein
MAAATAEADAYTAHMKATIEANEAEHKASVKAQQDAFLAQQAP